jgi:acylphosphatase
VRNEPDGTLAAVFEGDADRIESLVRWCGEGPRGASVEDVEVAWEEPHGEVGFSVR